MNEYQIIRLPDGQLARVPIERIPEPPIVIPNDYEQEYQRPAVRRPQTIRGRRKQERTGSQKSARAVFNACVWFGVGFLALGYSPWLGLSMWVLAVLGLINCLLSKE